MIIFISAVSAVLAGLCAAVFTGLVLEKSRNRKNNPGGKKAYTGSISIIIPARNEAENLPALFTSLLSQSRRDFEVVLVDDRSEDGSLGLMKDFAAGAPFGVKVVVNTEPPGDANPKVNVLLKALEHASGDLFLFTDADCRLHPEWVSSLSSVFLDERIGMACGLLSLPGRNTTLNLFQNFDHFYRMAYAFGAIGLGAPIGCYGNNMAIRKDVFNSVGGYGDLRYSATEDADLLNKVKYGAGFGVRALFAKATVVMTCPEESWKSHSCQGARWAAGAVFSGNLLARLGFLFVMAVAFFCLVSIPCGLIFNKGLLVFPVIMYAYLLATAVFFGITGVSNRAYWRGLLPSVFLFPFVYLESFVRILVHRRIDWKGTVLSWKKRKNKEKGRIES